MEDLVLILTMCAEAALLYFLIRWLSSRLSPDEKSGSKREESGDDKADDPKIGLKCLLHGTIVSKGDWFNARR